MNDTEGTLMNEGVIEVLSQHLHETDDEALQAALWQILAGADALVTRIAMVRRGLGI